MLCDISLIRQIIAVQRESVSHQLTQASAQ